LAIPNYEIKTVFQDIIIKWLCNDVNIKRNSLIDTTKYLIYNEIEKFEIGFKEIIEDVETWHATSLHTSGMPRLYTPKEMLKIFKIAEALNQIESNKYYKELIDNNTMSFS